MIVDLLVRDGLVVRRVSVPINQVVVRQDNGTPVALAAEYGPDGSQVVTKIGDDDFNRMLRNVLGEDPVICDLLDLPKPFPGARLIAGPRPGA